MWNVLAKQLLELIQSHDGPTKPDSGALSIIFSNQGQIYVTLGVYDIPKLGRYIELGPFKTEKEAETATMNKLKQMWNVQAY